MALNTPTRIYTEGGTVKMTLYRFVGFTSGDTFNLASDFQKVLTAFFMVADTEIAGLPAISSNTILTPANAGLTLQDGYLLAVGDSN
jgi:hypothetical protein